MLSDDLCTGFLPQLWMKDRCKKCFRLERQHGTEFGTSKSSAADRERASKSVVYAGRRSSAPIAASSASTSTSAATSVNKGRNHTSSPFNWRRKVYGNSADSTVDNGQSSSRFSSSSRLKSKSERFLAMDDAEEQGGSSSVADDTAGISASSSPGSSRKQRSRLKILRAEVSIDDRPMEEVVVRCELKDNSGSPGPSRSSSRRSLSPPDAEHSFASAISDAERSVASAFSDNTERSFVSANSGGTTPTASLSKATSFESLASTLDSKSLITAMSGSDSSQRSNTPTNELDDSKSFISSIKAQLEIMENKCAKLEAENALLRISEFSAMKSSDRRSTAKSTTISKSTSPSSSIEFYDKRIRELQEKLTHAENISQDYRDENTVLKCELNELQENIAKENTPGRTDLRNKLAAAESLCDELLEENEALKRDVQELQHEIEELHDQYREEEIDEFREIQKELEQTAKNCRILQFKLRKSERKCDQTEADKHHLEERMRDIFASTKSGDVAAAAVFADPTRIRDLEAELKIAKEVSVRLHNELENAEEKRCKLEEENFYMKEKVRELETNSRLIEANRNRNEQRRQLTSTTAVHQTSRGRAGASAVAADSNNNSVSASRDLQDALERETDLKDQLKFAEEDALAARQKISDLETENEGLMRQLTKLAQFGSGRGRAQIKRSFSEGHTQIQLELAEHEATVLKQKMGRLEHENELMSSKVSLLEKELHKIGGKTEFSNADMHSTMQQKPDIYYKQKIRILEEEIDDLKHKLKIAQASDLQGFALIGSPLSGSNPLANRRAARSSLLRSRSLDEESAETQQLVDVRRQLAIVDQEATVLRNRVSDLEEENERIVDENKRLQYRAKLNIATTKHKPGEMGAVDQHQQCQLQIEQMDKDIHRFISRISDLEKEKEATQKEINKLKLERLVANQIESSSPTQRMNDMQSRITKLSLNLGECQTNLRLEQSKSQELESQINQFKQMINQSDNQKLVSMATKVEILTNQLRVVQERSDLLHRKCLNNLAESERKYPDMLKERIESLEKDLVTEKARLSNGNVPKLSSDSEIDTNELLNEITECHQLLSATEAQVEKICRQVEEIDSSANSKLRSSSFVSKSTSLSTAKQDTAALRSELQKIRSNLHEKNSRENSFKKSETSTDALVNGVADHIRGDVRALQERCMQQEAKIIDLTKQLDVARREKQEAMDESTNSTTRLLQTEERWNKELEKLKESYEHQVEDLKFHLQEANHIKEEKSLLLRERESLHEEKVKVIEDLEKKITFLEKESSSRPKDLQQKFELERKKANDLQTKYQKFEELHEATLQKLNSEREKFKFDLIEMKKRNEDIQSDMEKLKQTIVKKENLWQKERNDFEKQAERLRQEVSDSEQKAGARASEMAHEENKKFLVEIEQLKRRLKDEADIKKKELSEIQSLLSQKTKDLEFRLDEEERMKREIELLKARIEEQRKQLQETRRDRDESREELSRWQQIWTRERSELAHKMRQEEKVYQAEHHALQLKYESRIKVMDDSAKRMQTQLAQTRRERDQNRDALTTAERKMGEQQQKWELEEKSNREKLQFFEKQAAEFEEIKVQLDQSRTMADNLKTSVANEKSLFEIEKKKMQSRIAELENAKKSKESVAEKTVQSSDANKKLLNETVQLCNDLKQQLNSLREKYERDMQAAKELRESNRSEWSKEKQSLKKQIRETEESVKVMEIDRRNMLSSRDSNEAEKTQLLSERDTLVQKIHDSEIHQLANKYKLDKVSDQITDLAAKVSCSSLNNSEKRDLQEALRKALEQLSAIRDEMTKTRELGKVLEKAERDSASVTQRSASSSDIISKDRLSPIGSESASPMRKSSTSGDFLEVPKYSSSLKDDSSSEIDAKMAQSYNYSRSRPPLPQRSSSTSSSIDHTTALELRLAEIRMRSPSPSPRKITNYPEPPPSFILNKKNVVEYDAHGRRHWARRSQLRRSISCDPSPANLHNLASVYVGDDVSCSGQTTPNGSLSLNSTLTPPVVRAAHVRSASTGAASMFRVLFPSLSAASSRNSSRNDISSAESTATKTSRVTQIAELFGSLKRSSFEVIEMRKRFGNKKASSIETTDLGHQIGTIGVKVLPPAANPSSLPIDIKHASTNASSNASSFDEGFNSPSSAEPSKSKHSGRARLLGRFRSNSKTRVAADLAQR